MMQLKEFENCFEKLSGMCPERKGKAYKECLKIFSSTETTIDNGILPGGSADSLSEAAIIKITKLIKDVHVNI